MTNSFGIPQDVLSWLEAVFEDINYRVAEKVTRIPTVHETSLDLSFIEELSQVAAPFRLPSDWIVRLDAHYLGGMRHWGSWEIADIGVLVMLRRGGVVERSKIALLQSKRLYPLEQEFEEDQPIDYYRGFGRLWEAADTFVKLAERRSFRTHQRSKYKGLIVGNDQYKAIADYESRTNVPVYYQFYNPLRVPTTQQFPLIARKRTRRRKLKVGCRLVPADALRRALANRSHGYAPSYGDLKFLLPAPFDQSEYEGGWPIEHFVTDLLLGCKEGYLAQSPDDIGVNAVFRARGAPISAAISISISAPGEVG